MGIMDGGCSASSPPELSNAPATSDCGGVGGGGASKFLANLPSRGNFSSTVLSSNLVTFSSLKPSDYSYSCCCFCFNKYNNSIAYMLLLQCQSNCLFSYTMLVKIDSFCWDIFSRVLLFSSSIKAFLRLWLKIVFSPHVWRFIKYSVCNIQGLIRIH